MSTKVAEFEVLTEEQIKALPKSVKENVVFLTENVRPKELTVLNPLVTELLEMKDHLSRINPEKDEKGGFTKESIDDYKELKKNQRSFNGKLTKTASALQKPYQDINKGIISIRKTFKELSDEVKEQAEEKFAEYEQERKRKAEEAQAKKDAEMNSKIEEANKESEELKLKVKKSEVFNQAQDLLNKKRSEVMHAVFNYSKTALQHEAASLGNLNFINLFQHIEMSVLDEDIFEEFKTKVEEFKKEASTLIQDKIHSLDIAEQMKATNEVPQAPPVPKVENAPAGDVNFVEDIKSQVKELERKVDLQMTQSVTPELAMLKQQFLKFNEG